MVTFLPDNVVSLKRDKFGALLLIVFLGDEDCVVDGLLIANALNYLTSRINAYASTYLQNKTKVDIN